MPHDPFIDCLRFVDDIGAWYIMLDSEDRTIFEQISSMMWGWSAKVLDPSNGSDPKEHSFCHQDVKDNDILVEHLKQRLETLIPQTKALFGTPSPRHVARTHSRRANATMPMDPEEDCTSRQACPTINAMEHPGHDPPGWSHEAVILIATCAMLGVLIFLLCKPFCKYSVCSY